MKKSENEIWKNIEGYDGMYQISNFGRIKSFKKYKQVTVSSIKRGKIWSYVK